MNLLKPYGPQDEPARPDGDSFFRGVNERLPATSPEMAGFFSRAKNLRFTNGVAEPRLGIGICRWGKTGGQTPFAAVYGQPVVFYNAADGLEWTIIAADSGVWMTRPNTVAVAVALPAGITLTAATFKMFVVCGGTVVLLRGPDADPLACTNLSDGFLAIVQTATGDGTQAIPRSSFGYYFANRLLLIVDRDNVAVSDDGDYTRYSPVTSTFKINEGDNEELLAIAEMDAQTLLFLKERSVWYVTNIGGNLADAIGPKVLTRQYGIAAVHSITRVGSNVYWWSQQGLVSAALTQQNEIQAQALALTDDLPVTMARLNKLYQGNITCAYHDGFIYVAVPLDAAKIYGADLCNGAVYGGAAGRFGITTVIGSTYYYEQHSAVDLKLVDGAVTFVGGMEFAATTTGPLVYGTVDAVSTATVREVLHAGVCNAVLVFDTKQGAWAGRDESEATYVESWFKPVVQGEERLCFIGPDGWLRICNQGYEDETLQAVETPYVDVLVNAAPADLQTVVVNAGGSMEAFTGSTNNSAVQWGVGQSLGLEHSADNLWQDVNGVGGFNPASTTPRSAPNTTPSKIRFGVRFTATNGVLPDVAINGVSVTAAGLYGTGSWAYVEPHSGNEIVNTPIATEGLTRAYQCQDIEQNRFTSVLCLMQTWAATYSLSTVADGVGRTTVQRSAVTPSRTETATSGMTGTTWDTSNANNDHGASGRPDYSVLLPGTGMNLDPTGVSFDLHQDRSERVPVDVTSHWMQVEVGSSAGRTVLRAVLLEALDARRRSGDFVPV